MGGFQAYKAHKRTRQAVEAGVDARACHTPGCGASGLYPAPVRHSVGVWDTPETPQDKLWLCLDHVRDYNKSWDFFAHMSEREILAFQRDALTGHRHTRTVHHAVHIVEQTYARARRMRSGADIGDKHRRPDIPRADHDALTVLGLEAPSTWEQIRRRYRDLVKRTHPDHHGKGMEEEFKRINQAYAHLKRIKL